ncbi:MAG TPA: type II toxin-antitoxin system VapC family toxin [Gemmatimonadaceae bacterium]|nr:type II toxin-antitoxin system VapC family toxin [Gemmatimonadaceae bacterium]
MIAYIDSSVVLRIVFGQPGGLPEWGKITRGVTSGLLEVECLRTIDRLRLVGSLEEEDLVARREAVYRILEGLEIVEVSPAILRRAGQAMPAPLGTLDAIHLSTAELWREITGNELLMATHDQALALAARASGFRVLGGRGTQ